MRDYIHVSDLVAAHIAALKHQTDDGACKTSSELIKQLPSPNTHAFGHIWFVSGVNLYNIGVGKV